MKKIMFLLMVPFANVPPTCVITAPVKDQPIKVGETVVINVTAKDSDGTISKVEIFNGSTVISTQRSVPYTTTIKNIQPGAYTIKARATDNQGGVKTSTIVMIYVLNIDYAKEIQNLKDSVTALRKDLNQEDTISFELPLRIIDKSKHHKILRINK